MMTSKPQISGGGRKKPAITITKPHPPDGAIECPRCNSPDTKFCYYNNYSISQPRYYCKSCRRHWTNGGALRNVPIGGACRKYKKTKASLSSFTTTSSSSSSSTTTTTSALPFLTNPFSSIITDPIPMGAFPFSSAASVTSMVGMNYPLLVHGTEIGCNSSWSIESLSCINQELHWKLQQQEMVQMEMLFGDKYSLPGLPVTAVGALQHQKQQESVTVPLQSCGSSGVNGTSEGCVADADTVTAWFFDGSHTMANDSGNNSSSNNNGRN